MSRMSIATPCPAPYGSSSLPIPVPNRRLSTASNWSAQDDTAELEYTRAIQVEFKNAKPRRKSTFYKRDKQQAAVTIFEDVIEDEELVVPSRAEIGGRTLLGKPAQKLRLKKEESATQSQPLPNSIQGGKRSSIVPNAGIAPPEHEAQLDSNNSTTRASPGRDVKGVLKKEPRRQTIFVPSEDTTVSTIHPRANTTERLDDSVFPPGLISRSRESQQEFEAPQPAKKPRMSLAAAPKRVPLQQVAAKENNVAGVDVAGQNGGKENHPPQAGALTSGKPASQDCHSRMSRQSISSSRLFEPTAASRARQTAIVRNAVPLPDASCDLHSQSNARLHGSPRLANFQADSRTRVSLLPSPPSAKQVVEAKRTTVRIERKDGKQESPRQRSRPSRERRLDTKAARLQQYPMLLENLAHPELYEDNWLSHQEVALTELVNQIFDSAQSKPKPGQTVNSSLRERLIEIYHQPRIKTLHKRLKASLLYGALSRPRDMISPPNPALDIGLRKRFLGFWLDSYDTNSLCAAAEVVFGRQLPKRGSAGTSLNEHSLDPHKNRRALVGFLETFLVEVDDAEEPDDERGDNPNGRWRKMVLRSLMLIWLLDQAKTSQVISGCLFKHESLRKNSAAMLHGLVAMLVPSVGEISRVLRHLDYDVSHIQDPLDEVNYLITNIAVDLRNGILFTRLVEILLFSPGQIETRETKGDATITVQMPDHTILESAFHRQESEKYSRILSQHLKMPCLGRVQKTYNVQIAISALHDHGRLEQRTNDITANDIVDGHREKTLSLLWSLVSTHGLQQLVDFQEITADIKRMAGTATDVPTWPMENDSLPQPLQESLLKKWAFFYAARQGMRTSNLTTSFADGKVYAAILHGFSDYIHTKSKSRSSTSPNNSTPEAQLHSLGCSNAFIKQLRSANGTIPSRKTTISNLAFLAARLLPLARQANSARIIQRAYRLRRSRVIASQRVTLMRLASSCATVVQTQHRMVSAATVLQRAWRKVLDARITRLNNDVESFQALAKRWLLRRRAQSILSGQLENSHSLRIMGGW